MDRNQQEEDRENAKRARTLLRRKPAEDKTPLSADEYVDRQMKLWGQIKERLKRDGLYE